MPGDLLGLRARVLGRREDLPHVLNERLQRVRGCLRHCLSPLWAVSLRCLTVWRWRGQGVKNRHGPSRGADPHPHAFAHCAFFYVERNSGHVRAIQSAHARLSSSASKCRPINTKTDTAGGAPASCRTSSHWYTP